MFDVRKPKQSQVVLIRAATGAELSNYEKQKLASIETGAQKNKIESIYINGKQQYLDSDSKEVRITLGKLADKDSITSEDLADELFFIECELDSLIK